MERRPMLNEIAGAGQPAQPDLASSAQGDGRLATQFPSWDLLPPHTLLVRRRPVQVPKTPPTPEAVVRPPAAPPVPNVQAPAPEHVPVSAVASSPVVCRQCSRPLEDGAVFCSECGAKQD